MKFAEAKKAALDLIRSEEFRKNREEEDPRMIKFIPTFLEMNRLNFLTHDSQGGHFRKGISALSGKPYTEFERAYVSGFLPEKQAEAFIRNMALHTDKNAIFIPTCDDPDIPRKLDIPLTIVKSEGKMEVQTHMSTVIPVSHFDFMKKLAKLNKSEKVVMILCWDPLWNRLASKRDGLFTDVIRALKMK